MVLLQIRDRKDRSFFQPQVFKSVFDGLRSFAVAARDENSLLYKFPLDFEVYHTADLMQIPVEGESPVVPVVPPKYLCGVSDLEVPQFSQHQGGAQ